MQLKRLVDERLVTGDRAILKTVRRWKTGDGEFSAFYFRSEVCRKKEVPVYAVLGIPKGDAPVAGVLHYHGGGQTANPELVAMLVRQGYASISFDWTGPSQNRPHVTRWNGCTPRYSGMTPDESLLIRALTAGRQALSILAEHPRVDANCLGEFGVSWGGFQTWLLNAMDARLGAAVPIYGCGITREQVLACFRGELKFPRRFDPEAWRELYDPLHHAREQHGPTLFLNGTNDFFGWMDTYRRLAEELDGRHRCAFAASLNHSIGPLNPTLLAWYDCHLRGGIFPERPQVDGEWNRHGCELRSPVLPGAQEATFFVALEKGVGPGFCWMPVKGLRRKDWFLACLPSSARDVRRAMIYVHQRLAHGIESSSPPIRLTGEPSRRPIQTRGALPIDPQLWQGPAPVDPLYAFTPLRAKMHRGQIGLEWTVGQDRTFQFNTRVVARSRHRTPREGQLHACLQGPVLDPVTVAFLQHAGSPRQRHFPHDCSRADLERGIPLKAFQDSNGRPLPAGARLSHLYIGGKTKRPGTVRLVAAGWKK